MRIPSAYDYFFISHMVQMKGKFTRIVLLLFTNFISHMVQMKGLAVQFALGMIITFISHMVQMKDDVCIVFDWKNRFSLYPTWFRWKIKRIYTISEFETALYPTWFRWKRLLKTLMTSLLCSFISHMVQMKVVKSHLNSFLQFLLYIPHGSDESFYLWAFSF